MAPVTRSALQGVLKLGANPEQRAPCTSSRFHRPKEAGVKSA